MVNLFQFVVFFEVWKIAISHEARLLLDEIRVLALFEFIDTSAFKEWLRGLLKPVQNEDEIEIEHGDEAPSDPDESRTGTLDIIENLDNMLLFAFILFAVCLSVLLLGLAVHFNPSARNIYTKVKRKVFWNGPIRYVLQSTLKSMVAAGAVIAMSFGIEEEAMSRGVNSKQNTSLSAPIAILCAFCCFPLIFLCVLGRNKN